MAVVINLSDPGAVPGDSTNLPGDRRRTTEAVNRSVVHAVRPPLWGRNRIDEGVKGALLLGMVPPLSGQIIVANDNYAPVALAA